MTQEKENNEGRSLDLPYSVRDESLHSINGCCPWVAHQSYRWEISSDREEVSCEGGLDLSNFSRSLELFCNGFTFLKLWNIFFSSNGKQSQR